MLPAVSLEGLLRQGSSHVVFEGGDRLLFDVSNPKRLILQGVRNPDGTINEELASRFLSGVLYVCDGYESGIKLAKRVTINKKGEPSGELILDSETGKVLGGYG